MNEPIFALDIGTQSVTGILLEEKENKQYEIIDYVTKHHDERAMLDGQIHDVVQVASIIQSVKTELESNGEPLTHVAVAAAGRALKTIRMEKTMDITDNPLQSQADVTFFELDAVREAQETLAKQEKHHFSTYHCVGYSVLHYYIDGEKIGSLIDQVGYQVKVEIIATFLPKVVVESLLAALERANLTMSALTLEPIAAIQVLIPESMRRLNVALIDIGAGTSDIAIAKEETIVAYGMVPVAGDEMTEAISDHYLLDFKEAENVKQTIVNEEIAVIEDILGFETEITLEEMLPQIEERIDHLAILLKEQVLALNVTTPQAVMLIGGGSLTPKLAEKIAEQLQLPANRVAIRDVRAIKHIHVDGDIPTGPAFVTPVGIAVSATKQPLQYFTVHVNNQTTLMFESKEVTVGDCLVQAGIDINRYYGKMSLAKMASINGKTITLRGEQGVAPTIFVNDTLAAIDTIVASGDHIKIEKGMDGATPNTTLAELIGEPESMQIQLNGQPIHVTTKYVINGEPYGSDYIVQDRDQIDVLFPKNIAELLQYETSNMTDAFFVYVDDRKVRFDTYGQKFLLNGVAVTARHPIKAGDEIVIKAEDYSVAHILDHLQKIYKHEIEVIFNGTPVKMSQNILEVWRKNEKLQWTDIVHNGDVLHIKKQSKKPFIFQDVFRYVDIDMKMSGAYTLFRNGEQATFHDPIMYGDELMIEWT